MFFDALYVCVQLDSKKQNFYRLDQQQKKTKNQNQNYQKIQPIQS